jgi:hypothetical protein
MNPHERLVASEALLKVAQDLLGEQPVAFRVNDSVIAFDELVGKVDDVRRLIECVLIGRSVISRHTDAHCVSTIPACPLGVHE